MRRFYIRTGVMSSNRRRYLAPLLLATHAIPQFTLHIWPASCLVRQSLTIRGAKCDHTLGKGGGDVWLGKSTEIFFYPSPASPRIYGCRQIARYNAYKRLAMQCMIPRRLMAHDEYAIYSDDTRKCCLIIIPRHVVSTPCTKAHAALTGTVNEAGNLLHYRNNSYSSVWSKVVGSYR